MLVGIAKVDALLHHDSVTDTDIESTLPPASKRSFQALSAAVAAVQRSNEAMAKALSSNTILSPSASASSPTTISHKDSRNVVLAMRMHMPGRVLHIVKVRTRKQCCGAISQRVYQVMMRTHIPHVPHRTHRCTHIHKPTHSESMILTHSCACVSALLGPATKL